MTYVPDPRKNPEAKGVVQRFRQENFEPEGYTLYTFATVQVWAQAALQAKSFRTKDLVRTMRTARFKAVLGAVQFDEKGDIIPQVIVWYVWRNGKAGKLGSGNFGSE